MPPRAPRSAQFSTVCRSTWTAWETGDEGAPGRRTIHARRLGLRVGRGYFECGSDPWAQDWVTDARVLAAALGRYSRP